MKEAKRYHLKKRIYIPYALMVFAVLIVLSPLVSAQFQTPTYADVVDEAQRGSYRLIDMDKLWKLYQQENNNLILVDTRQDWEYHTGHIRNALNFSMEPTWLARLTNRGELEQFLGPDKTKTIVFY